MDAPSHLPDLPASLAREVFARLCSELPLLDTDEARAARDAFAMAAVAALHPADAFEANLAVRVVSADAHAGDSLRSAVLAAGDPAQVQRCRAQAASMARQSDAALRALLSIQAWREKQESEMHPSFMERSGWWFRDASVPAPPPPASEPVEPEPIPAEIEAEAARYAVIYPDRARCIRESGGLPAKLDLGPPEPAIVAALLKSGGSILTPCNAVSQECTLGQDRISDIERQMRSYTFIRRHDRPSAAALYRH